MTDRLLEIAEGAIDGILPHEGARPSVLSSAMRYAVDSGGKRIRPLVCLGSALAAGGDPKDAAMCAAAIELLHNYTLVHDDLPSMDGDEERRGKPTVWRKYGEANAILAADALQSLAFDAALRAPRNAAGVAAALAKAAFGVVKGQVEDIAPGEKDPAFTYLHKTADLFVAAAEMGALAAGADGKTVAKLAAFAENLGLAFQYEDDLLDGDGLYGREETRRLAELSTAKAVASLKGLPGDASVLAELANGLLGRKN